MTNRPKIAIFTERHDAKLLSNVIYIKSTVDSMGILIFSNFEENDPS